MRLFLYFHSHLTLLIYDKHSFKCCKFYWLSLAFIINSFCVERFIICCCWAILHWNYFALFIASFVRNKFSVCYTKKKSQYLWNKHITAWKMLYTISIHSLIPIRKLLRSLNSFLILWTCEYKWVNGWWSYITRFKIILS